MPYLNEYRYSYWGQNSYGATHSGTANGQKTLAYYCQVSTHSTDMCYSPNAIFD